MKSQGTNGAQSAWQAVSRLCGGMLAVLSIVLAGVVLQGCSSTPSIKDMTVRMRDTDDIKITDMRSIMAGGLLNVQVAVDNRGASRPIVYRFRWMNANGMQVGGDEGWKPLTIGAGQSGFLTGIAPHPSVTDFKFELSSN